MKCRKYVFYVKAFISPWHFVTEHKCFDAWLRKHGRGDLGGVSKSHCGQVSFVPCLGIVYKATCDIWYRIILSSVKICVKYTLIHMF